ncbi:PREDICTED: macrosialin-like, partial [Cyprinodon variegatus]|uniref:macrosialin-like n=1 Tax=Cyprinodon variegatus TaxID=28743 RepID=UPI000742A0A7
MATPTTPTTTPAPQPTPAANLTIGNYNLLVNKKVCLMAQMELQIRLETPKANGTFIVQPSQTKPSGECLETKANLTLSFSQGFITLIFQKIDTEDTAYAESVSLSLTYPFSKTGPSHYVAKNSSLNLFAARIGYCYSSKKETLYMGQGLYLDFSQHRMQAFNISNGEFGD